MCTVNPFSHTCNGRTTIKLLACTVGSYFWACLGHMCIKNVYKHYAHLILLTVFYVEKNGKSYQIDAFD